MVAYKVMARPTIPNSFCVTVLSLAVLATAAAREDSFKAPDTLVLKNGKTVHGLILKNSKDAVLIQEKFEEVSYPKSEIVRIVDDSNNEVFTGVLKTGDLPSWRVVANELRSNDSIRSMVEIPATVIDSGELKNIPYKSFRVNDDIELNIYGDPEDPACLEVGIYGSRSGREKLRKTLRSYLAGYLTTRDEISKLYGLSLEKGLATSGDMTIEITPKDADDAYGAWWISLYNKKKLAKVRLSDKEYALLVRPMDEVIDKKGRVIDNGWSGGQMNESKRIDPNAKVLLRGFYRDKDGVFRLIVDPVPQDARQKAQSGTLLDVSALVPTAFQDLNLPVPALNTLNIPLLKPKKQE